MAATVVTIRDESKWEVISEFLSELEQGGIVIGPAEAKRLDEKHGDDWENRLDSYIDYDFGGDADLWVDRVSEGNYSDDAITDALED